MRNSFIHHRYVILVCVIASIFIGLLPKDSWGRPNEKSITFPTFEPFLASRMWGWGDPAKPIDPDRATKTIQESLEYLNKNFEGIKTSAIEITSKNPVYLNPESGPQYAIWYTHIPGFLLMLRPLWEADSWNDAQLSLAEAMSDWLKFCPCGPKLVFKPENADHNHHQLKILLSWFHDQVQRPEGYGNMIFTFDDGPYRAMELPNASPSILKNSQQVTENLKLQLGQIEGKGWILQALLNDQVIWTRWLSAIQTERNFHFIDKPPTPLGEYGWKVHMSEGEYTHVYLDRNGTLLFYFVSW